LAPAAIMKSGWFDFGLAAQILPMLLQATGVSIFVTICGFLVALIAGIPLMLGRRSSQPAISRATAFFVEFVRSTPLLVQIFVFFYVLPDIGIRLDPIVTGIIALSLHYGCYMSEVYRSGLESIPVGQWDAAVALGYSRFDTYRFLIVPQVIPRIVPTAGAFLVYMLKDSPLLASIGVAEVMFVAKDIGQERFQYLEPITMCGLIFLLFSSSFSALVTYVESKVGASWAARDRYHG
jgi:polar amino acid transport system permease protein